MEMKDKLIIKGDEIFAEKCPGRSFSQLGNVSNRTAKKQTS